KQLRRVLVMNELDAEISGEVAKYDAANKGVDPETRSDAVAKIIETIGEKYGYTNLAHFISRHGAARINPATGAAKRTDADFVSRLATGVGPDRKPDAANMPADKITETIDGTSVDVPVYAKAGYETASGASQHASAKAALY